ncbi:MAG: cytochrome c3 family protein [Nitrospirota bacterium]
MKNLFILLILGIFIFSQDSAFADPSEVKKDCKLCHISHRMGEKILLKKPVEQLCIECHSDKKGPHEHAVDVKPPFDIPKDFPLNEKGFLTCVTCHAPHGEGNFKGMLRVEPNNLCTHCHKR